MSYTECPICDPEAAVRPAGDKIEASCERCGQYTIVGTAISYANQITHATEEGGNPRLGPKGSRKRANASSWLRENPKERIHGGNFEDLASVTTPSVLERSEKLMRWLGKSSDEIGAWHSIQEDVWLARAWCKNRPEMTALIELLNEQTKVEAHRVKTDLQVKLTARGWQYLEELYKQKPESQIGFVAMWFDPKMRPLFDKAIKPAIEQAGYEAIRIDDVEHVEDVNDEILSQIRRSRFIVADYTGNRGGVYFESGFARGLGLPVFWTCMDEEDHKRQLHFDTNHFNFIFWKSHEDLKERLRQRIEAVIGRGSNIRA